MPHKQRPTFEQACSMYVHRYTMEHVPQWARQRPYDHGGTEIRYYAPQFRTDREWYNSTLFPGDTCYPFGPRDTNCYTTGQTWPLGQWLDRPFIKSA